VIPCASYKGVSSCLAWSDSSYVASAVLPPSSKVHTSLATNLSSSSDSIVRGRAAAFGSA